MSDIKTAKPTPENTDVDALYAELLEKIKKCTTMKAK